MKMNDLNVIGKIQSDKLRDPDILVKKIKLCKDLRKINQDVRTRDKIPVSTGYENCCSWKVPVKNNRMVKITGWL